MSTTSVLGVDSPDPVLSLLASLGLAICRGTALIIDPTGDVKTGRTIAELGKDGPSLGELSPGRGGVALLSALGSPVEEVEEVVETLARHWPAVVVRRGHLDWKGPVVPVRALLPGLMAPSSQTTAVWQPTAYRSRPPGPGPVLPRLRGRTAQTLLKGRVPTRSRWVSAWLEVWGLPWA